MVDCLQITPEGSKHEFKVIHLTFKGRVKKNCEKAIRLTALGGEGSPPSSLTNSICENVDPFLPFIK